MDGEMGGVVFAVSVLGCLAEDFAGKVVPANIAAGVGGVVNAVFFGFDHIHQQTGQIVSVRRGADLVVDNAKFGVI